MNELLILFMQLIITLFVCICSIGFFRLILRVLTGETGEIVVKITKVVLYGFITIGTLHSMLWIKGNNTFLNFCIFLVSYYELLSNLDEIVSTFPKLHRIEIDGVVYKVRVKKIQ